MKIVNYKLGLLLVLVLFMSMIAGVGSLDRGSGIAYGAAPTVITSLPYVITTPGVYVLNTDLTTTGDGIIVDTANVTIIGNGHMITGPGIGAGINMTSHEGNITITNLTITNFSVGINAYDIWSPGNHDGFSGVVVADVSIMNVGIGINFTNFGSYGGFIIDNVHISDFTDKGIFLMWDYGGVISNTILEGTNTTDSGVYVKESDGLYIYNTTIRSVGLIGIYFYRAYDYSIVSSIVEDSGYGVYSHTSYDSQFLHNTFTGNRYGNLYFINSGYFALTSNNISYAGGPGIFINETYYSRISDNYIGFNDGDGIQLVYYSYDFNITGNQIIHNNGYGVSADTTSRSNLYVARNVFEANALSPQALDVAGIGNWTGNYWSDLSGVTYTFTNNVDPSPLADPLYEVHVVEIGLPLGNLSGKVPVNVTIRNPSPADASNIPISIAWSEPPSFQPIPYTWIIVDPSYAISTSSGMIVTDYGNYTLDDYDDGYIVYKLPTPIEVYGETYTYIAATTNGYIELLTNNQTILYGDYSVHLYGLHRTYYNPTDPYGVTTLFAYSGDLYAVNYMGVFNMGDRLVIVFNGSTYSDEDPVNYPVNYEIIIYNNGSIIVTLGNITLGELDGDGFTGLYHRQTGMEITAGYMLPPFTSYKITPSLHSINTTNITVPANTTTTVTLTWDTTLLPHYSPYSLWTILGQTPAESNPINNLRIPITVNIVPPSTNLIGGRITTTNSSLIVLIAVLTTVIITTISIIIKHK